MALNDLILRSESHSPLTTKGSELTYAELDGNFIELYDYLSAMNSGSGIAPYDNSTTYSGTEYVSYNGNIYVHISATSTTGVLPDSDATKWQLTSIGALAHQQNKDTYLAFGSASQVSATDLYSILNEQIINITYSAFTTAKNNATLKPNRLYCITNTNALLDTATYTNSFIRLYIRTISSNQYSGKGFISLVAPNYNSINVYDYTYPYLAGDRVSYGLFVYECTSATSNGDTPNFDVAHWTIKSYNSFPAYYITRFYDVDWYDYASAIYISKIYDKFNNVFGSNDFVNANILSVPTNFNNDFDSLSSWDNIFGNANGVYSNKFIASYFFSKGGYAPNGLNNNVLVKSGVYCSGFILGDFYNNTLTNTILNIIPDFTGTISNVNISFSNPINMNIGSATIVNGGYMNEKGSNITAQVDINGTGGVVDLDSLINYADIYGVFEMDCSGDMIDYLLKSNYYCPIVIKPISAHQSLTLKIYSLSGATDNNCVSSTYSASNYDLYTDNGDYAVLERVTINGVGLWNVTYINKIA